MSIAPTLAELAARYQRLKASQPAPRPALGLGIDLRDTERRWWSLTWGAPEPLLGPYLSLDLTAVRPGLCFAQGRRIVVGIWLNRRAS